MNRRVKQAAAICIVAFAAAQLVRPEHANPPIDPSRTIQARMGATSELAVVLDRSCRDCHSNDTVWPWYTQIAPLSWLMARGVAEGRKVVNFSEWASYPSYTLVRTETKLSPHDIETICTAARYAGADPAGAGRRR